MSRLRMPNELPVQSPVQDAPLQNLTHLALKLSGRLAAPDLDDLSSVIAAVLAEIATALGASSARLVEFTDAGTVAREHSSVPAKSSDDTAMPLESEAWLLKRLALGKPVSMSPLDGLPCFLAALPSLLAGRLVCALVVERSREAHSWSLPLQEQLQLLTDIIGAAFQRRSHERLLTANMSRIQELNERLRADNVYLKEELKSYHDFDDIVGESVALRTALNRVAQVAPTHSSVLLLGQTGTGKELFARALHARSPRHARAFVRVNCAALPPTLVESELFGHEKGAFTGAVTLRQGRFEVADGGTIFLDEIGDLTPEVQVKFLRVLQEGEFERVGSSRTRRVDVRIIAATHHDLEAAVAQGSFRADLYYRLSVYPICLPSLHERAEDIPRLVWFFINRHQRALGRRITEVPDGVMRALQHHAWPGNVRELENVVTRAMIASNGSVLALDEPLAPRADVSKAPEYETASLDALQAAHIQAVLERCNWRINGKGNAAERLGIHPNTLRFRMKKLGLARPTV